MNAAINKLERKYGKYAISNISLYLVLLYAAAYVLFALDQSLLNYISLNPYAIMRGQIWRIVTWIMIPPSLYVNFLTLLLLYVFYMFGTNLERAIGAFRYNLYLLSGMVFTFIGALIAMAYLFIAFPELTSVVSHENRMAFFADVAMSFSTFYVYMSIFMAVAVIMPDMTILLMFILPVKMKYLGIIYGFVIFLEVLSGNFFTRVVVIASMLNFLIFFWMNRPKLLKVSPQQIFKRAVYKHEVKKTKVVARHKCFTCGVTSEQAPEREFRYCSKCEGNYEYCDVHLYTHVHVSKGESGG